MERSVETGVENARRDETASSGSTVFPPDTRTRIHLLGRPRIVRDGQPVPLQRSRRTIALLAFLAMARRPVTRSRLCELLWDVPNDPRGELRWTLSKLRGLIDEPARRRVLAESEWVSLDVDGMFIDAQWVERDGDAVSREGDVAALSRLDATLEGTFLEGLSVERAPLFENWSDACRGRFASLRASVLNRLCAMLPNDSDAWLALARRRLEVTPLDETAQLEVHAALTHRGLVAEAQARLRTARQLFEKEGLDFRPLLARCAAPRAAPSAAPMPSAGDEAAINLKQRATVLIAPFEAPFNLADLAEGVGRDVTSGLARLRGLLVIARASALAVRGQTADPVQAGRLLNADYVVTGTMRRDGETIRQFLEITATVGSHIIWTDTIDVPRAAVLEAPGTIASLLVSVIDSEIEASERRRAILAQPDRIGAWETYHRGLWHMYLFNKEDNARAAGLFRRSIDVDPTFSRAHAGLSFTHFQSAFLFRGSDGPAEAGRALDAAMRGLAADDRDPAVHYALGRALWLRGEQKDALDALDTAVELSPSFAMGHYAVAFVHSQSGDAVRAIEASDMSRRLSPYDPLLFGFLAARAFSLLRLGQPDESAEWASRAAKRPNAHVHVRAIAALCLSAAGRPDEALDFLGRVLGERPAYRFADFASAFRLGDELHDLCRCAADRIGLG